MAKFVLHTYDAVLLLVKCSYHGPIKYVDYLGGILLFPGGFNFANITCHVIEFGNIDLIIITYFYHMSRSRL